MVYKLLLKRPPTIADVVFYGIASSIIYYALYYSGYTDTYVLASFVLLGLSLGVLAVIEGLDKYKLVYSLSTGFILIYGILYIALVVLLGLTGIPGAFSVVLSAVVGAILSARLAGKRPSLVSGVIRVKMLGATDKVIGFFTGFSLVYLVLFLVIPLIIMFGYSIVGPEGVNFYWFKYILTDPKYVNPEGYSGYKAILSVGDAVLVKGKSYGIILNSLINSSIVTVGATILGVTVATIMTRYEFPGKGLLRIIVLIPMLVTPFVNAYVIKVLVGPEGLLGSITKALLGKRIIIDGYAGVTLTQIMAFYPIVYLNALASFANIDPSLEEQAESLGARGRRLFFNITLPLALPGIMAGSTLVFIYSLEDLGAPIVFSVYDMMSPQIYYKLLTYYGGVMPEVAALGVILLGIAAVSFLAAKNFVGMRQYAMLRQQIGERKTRKLGPLGLALVYLVVFPVVIFTAMPQIGVALMAFNILPISRFELRLDQATLDYFKSLFADPALSRHVANTLIYASLATLIIAFLALAIAYAASRSRGTAAQILDTLATLPLAVPGLVVAVGYFALFGWLSDITHLYQIDPANPQYLAIIPIVIAFSVRKLPFAARAAYAGMLQLSESLEEASMNLGAGRLRTLFSIVLPLIGLSILAGSMISFIYCATEVSVSVTLGNVNEEYRPMTAYMLNQFMGGSAGNYPIVASMGLLLIIIQLAAIITVTTMLKQRFSFIGI